MLAGYQSRVNLAMRSKLNRNRRSILCEGVFALAGVVLLARSRAGRPGHAASRDQELIANWAMINRNSKLIGDDGERRLPERVAA
jgi:hypothetical protein